MARKQKTARGYSRRKVNTREVRQRFLIVCEGEKTEPSYFKRFRVPTDVVIVDIKGLGGKNPSTIVRRAEEIASEEDYDQVWCVFDRDDWPPEDFNRAIERAVKLKYDVAYSNEAFELWYVLHFEFLNTAIPRKDYCKKLTTLMGKKYKKNSPTIYDELVEHQSIAIKNSARLLNQYDPANPCKDNPSTTVHLLVKALNKFIP